MTINGPAPMILAFFMNTAIDQQVEKYLRETGSGMRRRRRSTVLRGRKRPAYEGELPEGNDGLGLALLGISGDKLVDAETYARIRKTHWRRSGYRAGRHSERRPGAKHLHLLDRIRDEDDGRCPAVFHRQQRSQLLQHFDQRIPYRGGRGEPDQPAGLYVVQRLHHRRVLPRSRHGDRRFRAEPEFLLLQWDGPGIHRHRSGGAAHLGTRHA